MCTKVYNIEKLAFNNRKIEDLYAVVIIYTLVSCVQLPVYQIG